MKKNYFFEKIFPEALKGGWVLQDSGKTRRIDYNEKFALLSKTKKLTDILEMSADEKAGKPDMLGVDGLTPKNCMEYTTETVDINEQPQHLNSINKYILNNKYLDSMRSNIKLEADTVVIQCDCLYDYDIEHVLTYNYSLISSNSITVYVFVPFDDKHLSIDIMLSRILNLLNTKHYRRCSYAEYEYINSLDAHNNPIVSTCIDYSTARNNGIYLFYKNKPTSKAYAPAKDSNYRLTNLKYNCSHIKKTGITLLGLTNKRFLAALEREGAQSTDLLSAMALIEHADGVFSLTPSTLYIPDGSDYFFPVSLIIRDAVHHFCGSDSNKKYFRSYAEYAEYKCSDSYFRTKYGDSFVNHLSSVLDDTPQAYFDYAFDRCVSGLLYIARIWGINRSIPVTATSASADLTQKLISENLHCGSKAEYLHRYCGLRETKGKTQVSNSKKYYRNKKTVAVNAAAEKLQHYASKAYRGGYNACFSVDVCHGKTTYDIDLCSAYPTALCLTPDIDWLNPIEYEIKDRDLTLIDFLIDGEISPMAPVFARCTYAFPEDCNFPCLRQNADELDDDTPSYPIHEDKPVYFCGAELFLALKMGAIIHVEEGIKARILRKESGEISYSLRPIVKAFVNARTKAAEHYRLTHSDDSKGLEEVLMKLLVNSVYGKIAQNVSSMFDESTNGQQSSITNPVISSLITSLVRAVIIASATDITEHKHRVYSATTDGLITDACIEEVNGYDLFGINRCLIEARQYITEKSAPEIWSLKHRQSDLLNFTTRGNASFAEGGVIARNGLSSANKNLSKEDVLNRKEFIKTVVSRTGPIPTTEVKYTPLVELCHKTPFSFTIINKNISMDFDLKRKPVRESLKAEFVVVNGVEYEVAMVETAPYKDASEMTLYRTTKKSMKCLRTVAEWEDFFDKIDMKMIGCKSLPHCGKSFRILCDVIKGYKAGMWTVPYLDNPKLSVQAKVDWINSFNSDPEHAYTKKTWEKASEKKFRENILPYEVLRGLIDEMNADTTK